MKAGTLSRKNVEYIANRMLDMLQCKVWCVATSSSWNNMSLEVNQYLVSNWVDNTNDLIRCRIDDDLVSIIFQGVAISYMYYSRLLDGQDLTYHIPHFEFTSDSIIIKHQDGFNNLINRVFKTYAQLPYDPDEYRKSTLDAHYKSHSKVNIDNRIDGKSTLVG